MVLLKKQLTVNNNDDLKLDECDVQTKLLIPRLTQAEINARTLEDSELIYNTTSNAFQYVEGGVASSPSSPTGSINLASGESYKIDSQISLSEQICNLRGLNSRLELLGSSSGYVLFPNNASIYAENGNNYLDITYLGSQFMRFDITQQHASLGGTNPLSKVRLSLYSGANENHSLLLPNFSAAGETDYLTTANASPSSYNGSIWYNGTTNEVRAYINGNPYDLIHSNSTDLTFNNISDVTSTVMGVDDVQSMSNKTTEALQFTPEAPPAHNEGKVYFDSSDHTLSIYNDDSNITHNLGQEGLIRVYNSTGVQLNKAELVYISGVNAGYPTVALARADSEATSRVLGFVSSNIANGAYGYVTYYGVIKNIDTSAYANSDRLYLSVDTAGLAVNSPPIPDGNYDVEVGYCIESNAVTGSIFVDITTHLSQQAGEASRLAISCQKDSVGTLNPGDVCYLAGYDVGAGVLTLELAQSNSSATMPAYAMVTTTCTQSVTGKCAVVGRVVNLDTSAWTASDALFVSPSVAGTLTNIRPTLTNLVQKFATVLRSHPSQGEIFITGSGQSYNIPNLDAQNHIFVGDANGLPVSTALNTVAMDLTSSQEISGTKTFNDTIIIKSGTDNIPRIQAVGPDGLTGKLSFQNDGSVEAFYFENANNILQNRYSMNLTLAGDANSAYRISGNNVLKVASTNRLEIGPVTNGINNSFCIGNDASPYTSSIIYSDSLTLTPSSGSAANDGLLAIRSTGGQQNFLRCTNTTNLFQCEDGSNTLFSVSTAGVFNLAQAGSKYQINGTDVLTSSALGSGITSSSLTSTGTLTGLTVSNTTLDCTFSTTTSSNPRLTLSRNATNSAYIELSTTPNLDFYLDTVKIATLDTGGFNLTSSGDVFGIAGQQVVKTRISGWTLPTGTSTRTGFVTSTVTLQTLAEHVKALIEDLHASAGHGLIGA